MIGWCQKREEMIDFHSGSILPYYCQTKHVQCTTYQWYSPFPIGMGRVGLQALTNYNSSCKNVYHSPVMEQMTREFRNHLNTWYVSIRWRGGIGIQESWKFNKNPWTNIYLNKDSWPKNRNKPFSFWECPELILYALFFVQLTLLKSKSMWKSKILLTIAITFITYMI